MHIPDFTKMHPDEVVAYRANAKIEAKVVMATADKVLASLVDEQTCQICEDWGWGYGEIPEDWAYIVNTNATLWSMLLVCNNCLGRWFERFGELPELTRELGVLL